MLSRMASFYSLAHAKTLGEFSVDRNGIISKEEFSLDSVNRPNLILVHVTLHPLYFSRSILGFCDSVEPSKVQLSAVTLLS
jgi:hypothetical protein